MKKLFLIPFLAFMLVACAGISDSIRINPKDARIEIIMYPDNNEVVLLKEEKAVFVKKEQYGNKDFIYCESMASLLTMAGNSAGVSFYLQDSANHYKNLKPLGNIDLINEVDEFSFVIKYVCNGNEYVLTEYELNEENPTDDNFFSQFKQAIKRELNKIEIR